MTNAARGAFMDMYVDFGNAAYNGFISVTVNGQPMMSYGNNLLGSRGGCDPSTYFCIS